VATKAYTQVTHQGQCQLAAYVSVLCPKPGIRLQAVVYRRYRQALSTALFCRAGQLATADSCLFNERIVGPYFVIHA